MGKNHTNSQRSGGLRSAAHAPEPFGLSDAGKEPGTAEEAFPIESPIQSPIASAIKSKVLIVHHAPLVRSGLAGLIDASDRFTVCAQTGDAPRAREMFVEYQPHLVLLGLTLHRGNGIELIKDFERLNNTVRTLVLSAREDPLSIQRAFRAGAHGYLGIEDDGSEVLKALDWISAGYLYASTAVTQRLLESLASNEIEPARSEVKPLSDRELQVFSLIGRGFGASRLASELHLSVKTIETYQAHIKEKLGLRSAAELSDKAARWTLQSMRRNRQLKKLQTAGARAVSI
ncbi:MAG: DNA-binding response regulator [Verrucomicrobia bacterium]|nr:MAG: DNA-binding response regulator [Verrucomicrobiota bacterium]